MVACLEFCTAWRACAAAQRSYHALWHDARHGRAGSERRSPGRDRGSGLGLSEAPVPAGGDGAAGRSVPAAARRASVRRPSAGPALPRRRVRPGLASLRRSSQRGPARGRPAPRAAALRQPYHRGPPGGRPLLRQLRRARRFRVRGLLRRRGLRHGGRSGLRQRHGGRRLARGRLRGRCHRLRRRSLCLGLRCRRLCGRLGGNLGRGAGLGPGRLRRGRRRRPWRRRASPRPTWLVPASAGRQKASRRPWRWASPARTADAAGFAARDAGAFALALAGGADFRAGATAFAWAFGGRAASRYRTLARGFARERVASCRNNLIAARIAGSEAGTLLPDLACPRGTGEQGTLQGHAPLPQGTWGCGSPSASSALCHHSEKNIILHAPCHQPPARPTGSRKLRTPWGGPRAGTRCHAAVWTNVPGPPDDVVGARGIPGGKPSRPPVPGRHGFPGAGSSSASLPGLSFHSSASAGASPLRVMFGHCVE